jgi:nucleoside-diphosphate-sugar epimerase
MAYVEGLANLIALFAATGQRPKRIFFASSTAVFEQEKGEWVDETTPVAPQHYTGRRLLEAESLLFGSDFAGTVVRFAGIYGPRRASLVDRVRRGSAGYRPGRPRWTNRIHRDDCAGALRHLMLLTSPEKLYLGVDCEPAEESELLRWLAGAVGAPPPRAERTAEEAPARGNKRCRNDRLRAAGYEFLYPTYREGYTALLATGA